MMNGQLRDVQSEVAAAIAAVMVVVGEGAESRRLPGDAGQARPTEDIRAVEAAVLPWVAAGRHMELSRAHRIYERSRGRHK